MIWMRCLRITLMSKGPGKVQTQLIALFKKNADRYFSTEELCCWAFGVRRVEKKHRVSVLRALKRISEIQALNIYRAVKTHSMTISGSFIAGQIRR